MPPAFKCLRGRLEFKVPSWYLFLQGTLDEDKGPFTKIPGHLLPSGGTLSSEGTLARYILHKVLSRYLFLKGTLDEDKGPLRYLQGTSGII